MLLPIIRRFKGPRSVQRTDIGSNNFGGAENVKHVNYFLQETEFFKLFET